VSEGSHELDVDISEQIATVTIDRPPVNAIDNTTYRELIEVFRSFADDRDVRVAILTAAGDRAFIAGVDLKSYGKAAAEPPASLVVDPARPARDAMWAITDCAVPVIGAINGPALGAGLALAACCDIILASENATFGTTEINVGLLGASAHLSLLVGRHKAREMFFTGEQVPASELYRVGAVRAVVPRAELLTTARALATTLAAKSPIALRLAKESMNRVEFLPLKDAYRTEQDYTARLRTYEDATEARNAFLEKRDPDWKWR
jgi:enoyl-CoA hydratase